MRILQTITTCIILGFFCSVSKADITGFFNFNEWENAVGQYKTIDFTDYPAGTIITDQYAHLGVLFTDGNDRITHSSSFENDGAGLRGWDDLQITAEFEAPQLWFGVDHPGSAVLDIYYNGQLLGTFEHYNGGTGFFTGIISEIPFDKVVIHRGVMNTEPHIDDMLWGVPAPGALAVLALAGLLGGSRRRRRWNHDLPR